MATYDRVEFDQLVPRETFSSHGKAKIVALAAKYEHQGLAVEPLTVEEYGNSDKFKIVDGMLRYNALSALPYSHPARLSIPVQIV